MPGFVQIPHTEMDFAARAHLAGHFLPHDKIGPMRQLKSAFNRVVIGDSDEVHPSPLGDAVNLLGVGVALAAHMPQTGQIHGTRVARVDVKVTSHGGQLSSWDLSSRLKVLLEVRRE